VLHVNGDRTDAGHVGDDLVAAPHEQEPWLQPFVDSIPIPVFIKDLSGAYTCVNSAFLTLLQKTREEVVGGSVYDVSARARAEVYLQQDQALLRQGGTQVYDTEVTATDGTVYPVTMHKNTIQNRTGECIGILGTIVDHTDRNRISDQYRRASWSLGERVKELSCINYTTQIIAKHGEDPDAVIREIAELLPPAFQFPAITSAAVSLGASRFATEGFGASPWELSEKILAEGECVGELRVILRCDPATLDPVNDGELNSPFLPEEGPLLKVLAGALGNYHSALRSAQRVEEAIARLERAEAQAGIGHWQYYLFSDDYFISPTFRTLAGFAPDAPPPSLEEMLQRVHPDDREHAKSKVDTALGGVGVFKDRLRLLLPDGTIRWVDVDASIEFDDEGNPRQYFGTIQDVTEDVEHKLAIEASERLLRATFDQAAVGICHVAPDGRFLRVNEGACRILGYEEAAVLRLHVADLAATPDQPDDAENLDAVLRGALRNYTKKTRYRRRDGRLLWARVTVSLLRDQSGAPVHFIYIIEDITREQAAAEREQAMLQKLEKSLHGAISLLARTQEQADPYTAGHQQRVAELAVAIGRRMRLDESELDDLLLGAKIHDIGKINVPAQLLTKPGQITEAEFELIKTHCEAGYDILRRSEMPPTIADIVRHHHERWDGSGYPDGLTGTEISLLSRIVAVADTVEAVTSHRPYRPARGLDEARSVIRGGRGSLFDPQVVDHCLAVLDLGEVPWTRATL